MPEFLVDENLSPCLAIHLRELGYNAVAAREIGLKGATDMAIIKWIQKTNRVIVTGDLWNLTFKCR